jgi:hypothetical protein
MQGGRVSGNKVIGNDSGTDFYGGGVYVEAGGTFSMTGGIISGNSVNKAGVSSGPYKGGGVAVESGGSYSQSGGTIYGQNETAAELRNSAQDGGHALWNAGADSNNTL